jgi:hypothetical protein
MRHTAYTWLTMEELVDFVLASDDRTELEIELAQRLDLASDVITDLEADIDKLERELVT